MPFNSLTYFLFLPVVYLLFYFSGERARWLVLLAASILFYASLDIPYLLVVLALVTTITYWLGILIDRSTSPNKKRTLLWSGIAFNIVMLVVMKYMPFLSENINLLSAQLSLDIQIKPPTVFIAIGVSYFVFQAISYLFDIYLEIERPEKHLGYFALYLAFFPKLLQGPIERAGDLISQLKKKYEFNYDNMRLGMLLFGWGLFKKIVIADRLGLYVDTVYNNVNAFSGLQLLLATYAYAFQIYMDFSGYTDMALGSAFFFNIKLTQNFNNPYSATSIADFWRRWHISFSRWILDYVFRPLQMQWRNWKNRGTAAALIAAFIISGIWHGASWGFVIWGGLHGLYMACSVFYRPYQKKLHKALGIEKTVFLRYWQIFITFNLVSLAWIFFRTKNLAEAWYVVRNAGNIHAHYDYIQSTDMLALANTTLASVGFLPYKFLIFLLLVTAVFALRSEKYLDFFKRTTFQRWLFYYLLLIAIWLFHISDNQFIYFRF